MSRTLVWGLYALLVLVWSSTWVTIKIGLEDLPALLGAGIRFALAGAGLLAYAAVRRRPLGTDWLLATILGVLPFATTYGLKPGPTHPRAAHPLRPDGGPVRGPAAPRRPAGGGDAARRAPTRPVAAGHRHRDRGTGVQRVARARRRRARRPRRGGGGRIATGLGGREHLDQATRRAPGCAGAQRLGDARRRRAAAGRIGPERALDRRIVRGRGRRVHRTSQRRERHSRSSF